MSSRMAAQHTTGISAMSLQHDEEDYLVPTPASQRRSSARRGSASRRPSVTLLEPSAVSFSAGRRRPSTTSNSSAVSFSAGRRRPSTISNSSAASFSAARRRPSATSISSAVPESPSRRISGTFNTDDVTGYCVSQAWRGVWYLVAIATLGLSALVFHLSPYLWIKSAYHQCHLRDAHVVVVQSREHGRGVCHVGHVPGDGKRFYVYCNIRYVWDNYMDTFTKLSAFVPGISCRELLQEYSDGLDPIEFPNMRGLFGANEVRPRLTWRFPEPTFIIFSMILILATSLWIILETWYIVAPLLLLNALAILLSILRMYWIRRRVLDHYTSSPNDYAVTTVAHGMTYTVESWRKLVPGCVIEIPTDQTLHFDGILMGGGLSVDESFLSGSHSPVTKDPLLPTDEVYCSRQHEVHTVFAGSSVRHVSPGTLVLITATGHTTRKSEIQNATSHPQSQHGFCLRYECYLLIFLIILYVIVSTNIILLSTTQITLVVWATVKTLALILPCFLPVSLLVISISSERHLKAQGIATHMFNDIIGVGKTNLIVFDKTGTLTIPHCTVAGILPVGNNRLTTALVKPNIMGDSPITKAMAVCHGIDINGTYPGAWLDKAIFSSTNWILLEPGIESLIVPSHFCKMPTAIARDFTGEQEIGILSVFPFSSHLRCMSAVAQERRASDVIACTKGAPDAVLRLCQQNSVPSNTKAILTQYEAMGYQMIALASKALSADERDAFQQGNFPRSRAESCLDFLGFAVVSYPLKDDAGDALEELREAGMRAIIVSGDALNTAIRCGHDCRLITSDDTVTSLVTQRRNGGHEIVYDELVDVDHMSRSQASINVCEKNTTIYVQDGGTFAKLQEAEAVGKVKRLLRTTIYGQMKPYQKQQLIEFLKNVGYHVCMCGDGYNDGLALASAHTAIVLGDEPRDIRADYTATESVMNVVKIMREGRRVLACSQTLLKHHALCAFLVANIFLLEGESTSIPHMAAIAAVCVCIPSLLESVSPTRGRLSAYVISSFKRFVLSILGAMLINMGALVATAYFIPKQPWCDFEEKELPYQSTLASSHLVLSLAWLSTSSFLVFTKARSFKPRCLRLGLMVPSVVVAMVLLGLAVSLLFSHDFAKAVQLDPCRSTLFHLVIFAFWLSASAIHWILEAYVVDAAINVMTTIITACCSTGRHSPHRKPSHKLVRSDIEHLGMTNHQWPPPMGDMDTPNIDILGRRRSTHHDIYLTSMNNAASERSRLYDHAVDQTFRQIRGEYLDVIQEHHGEDLVVSSRETLLGSPSLEALDLGYLKVNTDLT